MLTNSEHTCWSALLEDLNSTTYMLRHLVRYFYALIKCIKKVAMIISDPQFFYHNDVAYFQRRSKK